MKKYPWQEILLLKEFEKKNTLPEVPGVYFFVNEEKEILYIGKATSLRDRVKSYFTQDLLVTRGPKVQLMLPSIVSIGYCQTDSVLEALILETELIKKYQPAYNTDAKDDKSYNRVVITKEKYPRVLLVRDREIDQGKFTLPIKKIYGPFPNARDLREALKIIRHLFPFRDTCTPYDELLAGAQKRAKSCFSHQIGLCPGVCIGVIRREEYIKNIRNIELFFEGKKGKVLTLLEKEMNALAYEQHFEEAHEKKKLIFGLQHIQDMALVTEDRNTEDRHRIEAYDVAHLQGSSSVGVMTVVQKGRTHPAHYRQFILRKDHKGNDLSALEEILTRRFRHPEWPFPELLVIDGGENQLTVARRILKEYELTIPLLSVVKDSRHKPKDILGDVELVKRFEKEIILVNAEAHRFAITFHKKKRAEVFLGRSKKKDDS